IRRGNGRISTTGVRPVARERELRIGVHREALLRPAVWTPGRLRFEDALRGRAQAMLRLAYVLPRFAVENLGPVAAEDGCAVIETTRSRRGVGFGQHRIRAMVDLVRDAVVIRVVEGEQHGVDELVDRERDVVARGADRLTGCQSVAAGSRAG